MISQTQKPFCLILSFVLGAASQADQVDVLSKQLTYGKELLRRPEPQKPLGVVAGLYSEKNKLLGTATKICTTPEDYFRSRPEMATLMDSNILAELSIIPQDRSYWITAAHVVDSLLNQKQKIILQSQDLRLEFRDDLMDLVLFSSTKKTTPCAALAGALYVGPAYDVEAVLPLDFRQIDIEIEAHAVLKDSIVRHRTRSLWASTFYGGLPGRDDAGPMLMFLGKGLKGQSGGAVLAQVDPAGQASTYRLQGVSLENSPFRRMVGMLTAVDDEGRRLAALPSSTIYKRILAHFRKTKPAIGEMLTETYSGATKDLFSGVLHFRGALAEAGTGGLSDGGTGGLSDGGTGGLSDGGTGGLSDGGNVSHLRASHRSGILFQGKHWLTLGTAWTEFEPLELTIKKALKNGTPPWGIYEQNGELHLSSPDVLLPTFLSIPDSMKDTFLDRYDLSAAEKRKLYLEKNGSAPELNCVKLAAMVREKTKLESVALKAFLCEREEVGARHFDLAFLSQSKKIPPLFVSIRLVKQGTRLIVRAWNNTAEKYMAALKKLPTNGELSEFYRLSLSADESLGAPLKNNGVRIFANQQLMIQLSRRGGFEVDLKGTSGKEWKIFGPMSLNSNVFVLEERLFK